MLFFNKETNSRFQRFFILSAVLLSFTLPLLKAPALLSKELSQSIVQQLPVNYAEEDFYIDPRLFEEQASQKLIWSDYLLLIYLGVAALFFIKLMVQLRGIISFIIKHRKHLRKAEGYYLAEMSGKVPTFSFFNFLFLNKDHWENEKEREQILLHELEHIKQRHTVDILLLELAGIVCWFNPAIYFFKTHIKAVHEYLADARVIDETKDNGYARLLVRSALSSMQLGLVNQFHNSLTFKRLNMMKTVKKNISKWKLGMLIPGIAIAIFIIACQDQIIAEMQELSQTTSIMAEFPPEFTEEVAKIRAENPDIKLNYIEAEPGDQAQLQKVNPKNILHTKVLEREGGNRVGMVVKYDENLYAITEITKQEGDVFMIVEETARPVGGMAAFYEFLTKEIKYPAEARRMGIEGKVFIEFIINTDGSISDVKPVRGIGGGCDEEAVRVISLSQNWEPGKQRGEVIRQRMLMPVVFNLGGLSADVPIIEYQVETINQLSTLNVNGYPRNTNHNTDIPQKDGEVYLVVEETASPKGGIDSFYDFIARNIQYPAQARRAGIEGKVFVQFNINTDGSISNVTPVRGIGGGCDEEAVRVVSMSPAWQPGRQSGQIVKQRMVLPITFSLSGDKNPGHGIIKTDELRESKSKLNVTSNLIIENGKRYLVGRVSNAEGKALPGANIVAVARTYGTVSDNNGEFKLEIKDDATEVAVSFVGFQMEKVKL